MRFPTGLKEFWKFLAENTAEKLAKKTKLHVFRQNQQLQVMQVLTLLYLTCLLTVSNQFREQKASKYFLPLFLTKNFVNWSKTPDFLTFFHREVKEMAFLDFSHTLVQCLETRSEHHKTINTPRFFLVLSWCKNSS